MKQLRVNPDYLTAFKPVADAVLLKPAVKLLDGVVGNLVPVLSDCEVRAASGRVYHAKSDFDDVYTTVDI
jgi:hypothetical protein